MNDLLPEFLKPANPLGSKRSMLSFCHAWRRYDRAIFRTLAVLLALLGAGQSVRGQLLEIDVPSYTINSGDPLTVTISVNNKSASDISISGLDFAIQTGNGGPTMPITSDNSVVDIITGTPFAGNNSGQSPYGGNDTHNQFWQVSKQGSPKAAPVLSPGMNLTATIHLDTSGVAPGQYALNLSGTFGGTATTTYNDDTPLPAGPQPINMTIVNGTITVVPEPAEYAMAVGGLLLGLAGIRRWTGFCRV